MALTFIKVFEHNLLVVPESCDLLFSPLERLLGFFEFLLLVLLFFTKLIVVHNHAIVAI